MKVYCDYCGELAKLTNGAEIYPHRPGLEDKPIYACRPCGAWVGCHPGSLKPLGRLADQQLRKAKMRVHAKLDPLWRSGQIKRSSAYARLADHLGITPQECHVGMFDLERCQRAEQVLATWGGCVPPRISPTTGEKP